MANLKVKSVNAYISKKDEKGKTHEFIAIQLSDGQTVFVNTGLVVYAIKNAKVVKDKKAE